MEKRTLLLAGRLAALAAGLNARGAARRLAWTAHNFLWLYPTLRRNCPWHGAVATRFRTDAPEVWLTIDDGPDPTDTPAILDALAHFGARATFFVIGKKVESHRALCRRILAEGHELGNHTHSHPAAAWWAMPPPLVHREIALGSHALRVATGRDPRFFRCPVGMQNASVAPALAAAGLRAIGWSADGRDGCPSPPHRTVARIMDRVRPGAILLLHEGDGRRYRAMAAWQLLQSLSDAGYRCVLPDAPTLM